VAVDSALLQTRSADKETEIKAPIEAITTPGDVRANITTYSSGGRALSKQGVITEMLQF
jgi:hypothetical protein